MIRRATYDDIPAVMEMGRRFADDAGVTAKVGWDDESVRNLLIALIDLENGILLVGEKGMIGGAIYPHPFNSNTVVFQELFWRSEGREGLRLYAEAEKWAREAGATHTAMSATEGMNPDGPCRIYERLGFSPFDRTFIKEL